MQDIILLIRRPDWLWGRTNNLFFPWVAQLYLGPSMRMSGATPLFPCMAWRRKTTFFTTEATSYFNILNSTCSCIPCWRYSYEKCGIYWCAMCIVAPIDVPYAAWHLLVCHVQCGIYWCSMCSVAPTGAMCSVAPIGVPCAVWCILVCHVQCGIYWCAICSVESTSMPCAVWHLLVCYVQCGIYWCAMCC